MHSIVLTDVTVNTKSLENVLEHQFISFVLVCSLVHQRRVQGIFGPPYPEIATLVHSICYHVDIPFINVCSSCYDAESFDEETSEDIEHIPRRDRMSINLYPSNQDLNVAFHNLTHKLKWRKFLIIYDMDSGSTFSFR